MPLDRHAKRFLDMVAVGKTAASALSPDAMRQAFETLARAVDVREVAIGACENRNMSGPAGVLPLRIYTPVETAASPLPALIYFHGGAGVFCSIDTHDGLCRLLANESGCRVISVGYRLAPEHKFPAAVNDACAATEWVFGHFEELAIDRERVGVAGDSAGATLAAVVCQQARLNAGFHIALQILICPVTDPGLDSPSRRSFSQGYFFDMAMLGWALGHCLPAGADLSDPRLAPLRAADLRGLPPAHIHTAEFDPFRDDGKAYAVALERAQVPVAYTCHTGMIHHFYCLGGVIPHARSAIAGIGSSAKAALSGAAG
jgi:acetyl esterase